MSHQTAEELQSAFQKLPNGAVSVQALVKPALAPPCPSGLWKRLREKLSRCVKPTGLWQSLGVLLLFFVVLTPSCWFLPKNVASDARSLSLTINQAEWNFCRSLTWQDSPGQVLSSLLPLVLALFSMLQKTIYQFWFRLFLLFRQKSHLPAATLFCLQSEDAWVQSIRLVPFILLLSQIFTGRLSWIRYSYRSLVLFHFIVLFFFFWLLHIF